MKKLFVVKASVASPLNSPAGGASGLRIGVSAGLALTLFVSGCTSVGNFLEPERVDYKSAGKVSAPLLSVPPDLSPVSPDNRYAVPNDSARSVTASGYNINESVKSTIESAPVAERSTSTMRIERDGTQRWLLINESPDTLWPKLKAFWQEAGFQLVIDNPQTGVLETDWAENRAKIPQDFIRNTLGKAFDSIYSTGERDKFRTRVERDANGLTEIYISHRGAEEKLVGSSQESSVWTGRPEDPQLEAIFLSRLMVKLGADDTQAKAAIADAESVPDRAQLAQDPSGVKVVVVKEGFDRTWRRVGLALDRAGFTVENRDKAKGLYYVRYVDQKEDMNQGAEKPGIFSRIFKSQAAKPKEIGQYQVAVRGNDTNTQVTVQNKDGGFDRTPVADKMLKILVDELK